MSVSQGAQARFFSYDGRGVMTAEQHPELGATGNGAVAHSRFDALGNPGRRVEAGITFDTTFDALGRPAKLEEIRPDSTRRPWREWSYGLGQTAANRSASKVVTATRHNWIVPPWGSTEVDLIVTQTSTYGGRSGRISAQSTTINSGGQSYAQTFNWNELGLLQSETYPVCGHATCTGSPGTTTPRTVSYVYTWGQLTNVSGWATIGYHPNGLVSRVTHGNGVVDTITNDLDEMARPLRIETTGASSNFKSGDYQYDSAGNIVKIGTDWYLYDARSRLVSSRVDDQSDLPGVDRFQSYTFDRYGNLGSTTTQIGAGAPITRTSPAVTTTNRLSGGAYDAFGNVTSFSGQSYAWDVLRMMKSSPGRFLIYGPGDERIWEFAYTDPFNAATFVETYALRGLGGQVLREYKLTGGNATGNWSLAEDFVYRDGQLLASATPTATTHFTLDHLGSPRLATGNGGTTLAYHAYYPFGEEATNPSQDLQRMKFTGHQRDYLGGGTTDDLDYMHARYGSPMTGRFLSVDPVLGDPGDPQSWNRYAYVVGNPQSFVDPTGTVLNFAGAFINLSRFADLVNKTLATQQLVISVTGTATLRPTNFQGPPSPQEQALIDTFSQAIQDSATTQMQLVSEDSGVAFGQFPTGKLDVQDLHNLGEGPGVGASGVVAHEVAEQRYKQSSGLPNTLPGFQQAHPVGLAAQAGATGYTLNSVDSTRFDLRTLTGTRTSTLSNGSEIVVVVMDWQSGSLKSVTRTTLP